MKSHKLLWQLMLSICLGSIILFAALHHTSYFLASHLTIISPANQNLIHNYAKQAGVFYQNQQHKELDKLFGTIYARHNVWSAIIENTSTLVANKPVPTRLLDSINFQRKPQWPIHEFMQDVVLGIKTPSGLFVMELPKTMRPTPNITLIRVILTIILPSVLLCIFCCWLYLHLMRPLNALKDSSIALSEGNLETRIPLSIANREDSIALVANAFNQMAGRIQSLVGYQRQFLHDLSHELRTPLTRLELAVDLAHEKDTNNFALQPRFKKDIEQMKALVEDTLTLAWLETEPEFKSDDSFNLSTLLDLICEDALFEYPQRVINRDYPAQLLIYNTNQRALAQSIENVLRNALKYSQAPNVVNIKYNPSNTEQHIIEIIDNGIGISPQELSHIFKPFYRTDKARSRKAGGAGLGLALTQRQITALRGEVSAKCNLSSGLSVQLILPMH
jgi:two-component system sensor histidine kinase PfeS